MDQYGSTPLMIAAKEGRFPALEYLLEKGADPNVQDNVNEQLTIKLLFLTFA